MKLRSRIMFLFTAGTILIAGIVMVNYINLSMIFEYFDTSLNQLNDFARSAIRLYPYPEPQETFALLEEDIQSLTQNFQNYRNRVYIQTVIFAILVMILLALTITSLKHHVINRLEIIRHFTINTYSEGLAHKRLDLPGQDELTDFAALLNKALDSMESSNSEYTGKLAQIRGIILTLMADNPHPTAYFRMSGDLLGSNLSPKEEDQVTETIQAHHQDFSLLDTFDKVYALDETRELKVEAIGPESQSLLLVKASVQEKKSSPQSSSEDLATDSTTKK